MLTWPLASVVDYHFSCVTPLPVTFAKCRFQLLSNLQFTN